MPKLPIRIEDLYRFRLVGDPQLAPAGDRIAFTVETMSRPDKTYYRNLYLVDRDGRRLRRLTHGRREDHTPRWSPDGNTLAFIRKHKPAPDQEATSQIWLLPLQGGEARPLSNLKPGAVSGLAWSPAGDRLAFLYHRRGREITLDKHGKPEPPPYRHIRQIWYRLDGEGFFDSEYTHLWTSEVPSGRTRRLVDGEYHAADPAWSPDGRELAFISFRHPDWQYRYEEQHIYIVPSSGGPLEELTAPAGPKAGPAYSPDGQTLAYLGHQRPYQPWGVVNPTLNTISRQGTDHRVYGLDLDRPALALTLGDITPSFTVVPPLWSPGGHTITYGISSEGRQPLVCADAAGGRVRMLTPPETVAVSWSVDREHRTLVYQGAGLGHPDELFVLDLAHPAPRRLTRLNRTYLSSRNFRVAEELHFQNQEQRLQGWLVKPPGFEPSRKYPLILNIHGGPRAQYGRTFFHEMYVLAAAGYVVLYTNPRGSQGYGEAFADAISGQWGEPAMSDVLAGVDFVLAQGYVDPRRLGVTGGSYGGYLTNWIVTHTNRFAAAVTQRSVSDLASMFGNSDMGYDMAVEFGGPPWENRAVYRRWSPITHVQNCHTPLLIIHSEQDLRCNIEQADQLFMALKYLRRETEYVRFPGEPHGLSRHGRPDRRAARLKLIVDWFGRYLQEQPQSAAGDHQDGR